MSGLLKGTIGALIGATISAAIWALIVVVSAYKVGAGGAAE